MDRERLAQIDEELSSLGKSESDVEGILDRFGESDRLALGDVDRELGELGNGRVEAPAEAQVATFSTPRESIEEPPPPPPSLFDEPDEDDTHVIDRDILAQSLRQSALPVASLEEQTHEELMPAPEERPPLELDSEDGPTIESEPPPRIRTFGRIPVEALDSDLPPPEPSPVAALEEKHPPLYDSEPPPAERRMSSEPPSSARSKPPRRRSESPPAWALSTDDLFSDAQGEEQPSPDDLSDHFAAPRVPRVDVPPTGDFVPLADDEDYMEEGRTNLFGEEEIAAIRSSAPAPGERSEADRELDALLSGAERESTGGYADPGRDSVEFEVMVDDSALEELDVDDEGIDFGGPTVPEADSVPPTGKQESESPAEEESAKKKPSFFKKLFG